MTAVPPGVFGLIGDVHAEDRSLERALELFGRQGVSCILCVGDIADGRGDIERCVALLEDAGALIVLGNHERWLLTDQMRALPDAHRCSLLSDRARRVLGALPRTLTIETPLGALLLCHGVGDDDMQRLRPWDDGYALETNDALQNLLRSRSHALVVGGHTHERMVRRLGDVTFINAGTLLEEGPASVSILDCTARVVRVFDPTLDATPLRDEIPLP